MRRLLWPAGVVVGLVLAAAWVGPPSTAQQFRAEPVRCVVPVSTATTLTAIGGECAAKPNLSLYITDIIFSTNAAGIAADSFSTLKYGTGTNCGTGTVIFWGAFSPAATQTAIEETLDTPLRLPQNVDVCWINSTAGSKFIVLSGYYLP